MVVKHVTLVRQASGADAGDFAARWRAHAESALETLPLEDRPTRLAHCVVRPHPGVEQLCDGVAIAHFEAGEAAGEAWVALAGPSGWTIETIAVQPRPVFGDDWLRDRWADPPGQKVPVVIGFLQRAAAVSRAGFAEYWWNEHRLLANRLVPADLQPAAYVHNYVALDDGARWDGIAEMYELSLAVARQRGVWFQSAAAEPVRDDERRFLDQATRQVVVAEQEIVVPRRHPGDEGRALGC
jgi:hypothetical protein